MSENIKYQMQSVHEALWKLWELEMFMVCRV